MKVGNLQRAPLGFPTLESDGKIQLSLWLSLLQGPLTLTTRSQPRGWMMPWLLGTSTPTSGSSVRTVGPRPMTRFASPTSTTPTKTWPRISTRGWLDLYLSVRKVKTVTPGSTTAETLGCLGDCTGVRLGEPWNRLVGDAGEGSGDHIMNVEKWHLVPTFPVSFKTSLHLSHGNFIQVYSDIVSACWSDQSSLLQSQVYLF